jgi:hypothetical protein
MDDQTEQYRQENVALKNEVARLKAELIRDEMLLEVFTLDDLLRKCDVTLIDKTTSEVLYTTKKVKHED